MLCSAPGISYVQARPCDAHPIYKMSEDSAALMARLVTDSDGADAKSRLVGIRIAMLSLRLRNNWAQMFGDTDTAAIVLAVVAIASERLMRAGLDSELETLALPLPEGALAHCNISSIAAATGINRETTRRKVDQLIKTGLLVREDSSIRLAPGFTQQEAATSLVRAQLDELRKAVNDLLRIGALTVQE